MIKHTKEEQKAYWNKFQFCPICEQERTTSCRCPRNDSICPNGHQWHNCTIHNTIVLGESDHSTNTFTCTCERGECSEEERKRWLKLQCELSVE